MQGLALALFLKKQDITSAVYELRPADYIQGGNISLAPNALRALDHVGIYDRVRNQGFNHAYLHFHNGTGELLGKFLNGSRKLYNFDALRIRRSLVRHELHAALKRAGIPIHYNKQVTEVVNETETKATVAFQDGEKVTTDFVIGADGIHSRIRRYVAPGVGEPVFGGLLGVGATVMADQLSAEEMLNNNKQAIEMPCMLIGATGSFAIMPASFEGDEIGYFGTLEADKDRGRAGWAALEADKDELYGMLSQRFLGRESNFPPIIKALCARTAGMKEGIFSWPYFTLPHLDSWSSAKHHRVVLLGDAAHAIPPTGGQGAAMALEDAETFAYVLGRYYVPRLPPRSFCGGQSAADPGSELCSSLPALIKAWERHRMGRIEEVLKFTTKGGDIRKTTPHFLEQAVKEWLLWALLKWLGPEGGAQWMYKYNGEEVLSCLS